MWKQILLINPLNSGLNPICHLLALLGAHHILHVSRIRVKATKYAKPQQEYWLEKFWDIILLYTSAETVSKI
jgi:hypothetical protein